MKNLLLLLSFLFISCSNDDGNSQVEADTRFKLIFDREASGKIIGDQSNKVIKRFELQEDVPFSFLGMKMKENNSELLVATKGSFQPNGNFNTIKIGSIRPKTILESDLFLFDLTEKYTIQLDTGDKLKFLEFSNNNEVLLIVKNNSNLTYKRFNSTQLMEIRHVPFFTTNLRGVAYYKEMNKLVMINETFPDSKNEINIFDLSNWNRTATGKYLRGNLFNSFSSPQGLFFISRTASGGSVAEYLTDIDGNVIHTWTETFDLLGRGAFGYDKSDNRVEYVLRADGRNETGFINTDTGEFERNGIGGEVGFHDSKLVYFNK